MRENDDDAPASEPQGSLADGLGETAEPYESSGDPYGDVDFGDTYGDDPDDEATDGSDTTDAEDPFGSDDTSGTDDSYGTDETDGTDGTSGTDDSYGTDVTSGTDDSYGTDGTYGDGSADGDPDRDGTGDAGADETVAEDATTFDDAALVAQANSPLEGLGFPWTRCARRCSARTRRPPARSTPIRSTSRPIPISTSPATGSSTGLTCTRRAPPSTST